MVDFLGNMIHISSYILRLQSFLFNILTCHNIMFCMRHQLGACMAGFNEVKLHLII